MLENLLDLIKQNAGSAIINNPAIPNDQNDAAVSAAGHSIIGGLKDMISSGNIQDVVSLFNHQGGDISSQPASQQLTGGFIQTLMNKFGLDHATASNTASSLIPNVLQQLVHKTNDGGDASFNIQGILAQLTGGQGGQSGAGGLDIGSLISQFTGGQGGSSGLMDNIKGMFSK